MEPVNNALCLECGDALPSNSRKTKFCSNQCGSAYNRKKNSSGTMSKHPALWTTDISTAVRRYDNGQGYVVLNFGASKWDMEHRLVLAQKLGRPLRANESAHHVNGVRHDNRPENLELWVGPPRNGVRAADLCCPRCGEAYESG